MLQVQDAPGVWFYQSHLTRPIGPNSDPSLVILCTWTGAQRKPIEHYIGQYQTTFPSAAIMVITTSSKDFLLRSSKRKQRRLKPAVNLLQTLSGGVEGWKGALMHVFSEGGSHKACELALAYHKQTSCRLPVSAICLDSTPGVPRFRRLCNALTLSFPDAYCLRGIASGVAVVALGGIWILYHVFLGYERNPLSRARKCFRDETYFDKTAPRCYLYSTNDALVWFKDVEAHANDSSGDGMAVTKCKFTSEHVKHALQDRMTYWSAVESTWNQFTNAE